ncbi:AMP-binding protein [Plebeiibacterium marinum]|uniref:AMP-binding protein n=1 Tax=Plebeiibacterium marinum TaxID=2992111 RepID=A0AAE3MEC3_9BACT|nr:AMP-binding protein [Plebeiobacterium marinum]MCW3805891.1 AMP-binding protein [Plebeiobacterium marinum]
MKGYQGIKLDGIYREKEGLVSFCEEKLSDKAIPEWIKPVYSFILEWVSDSAHVMGCTSGSTGKPKTIRLYKKHMIASAAKTVKYFNLSSEKTVLLCLSANYIAGKMMLVRAFVGGFNLLLKEPTGNPLNEIQTKVDFAAMIPMQVTNCLNSICQGDKVGVVIIGGGALNEDIKSGLHNAGTVCYETYGMTETVSHVAVRRVGEANFRAMPNVLFQVDSRNCLVIDAPDVLNEKLITNDIVDLVSPLEFKWKGRYDNVINSGGIKLFPEEIEKKLSKVLSAACLVSSVEDEVLGEKVVLVVLEGCNINEVKTILSLNTSLSKYEKPKEIVQIPSFPCTDTDKIQRGEVKNLIGRILNK